MKKILICCIIAWLGIGCGEKDKTKESQYLNLVSAVENLEKGNPSSLTNTSSLHDDAQALITRSKFSGYKLISPQELNEKNDEFIIIASLPRGIYNLGLIPHAKFFEFAQSPSLNEDGSDWNWLADALERSQEDFLSLLGENKQAKIVFYDSGDDILSPVGSAHLGLIWAKHLGYENLYRLIGGFGAWKDSGLPTTTEIPECCKM